MKPISLFSFLVFGILTFTGCSESTSESSSEKEEVIYSYDETSSILEWTAFKFTNKTGVKGTFNEISISGISESNDPKELIESLGFTIPTNSVETNDPDRNLKIATFFFGTISTDELRGKVIKLRDDGKAEIEVQMNGITKKVIGTYSLKDALFAFNATIDVLNWSADPGIQALNAQCVDNHTGTDGVIKLWSEVDLSFTTKLKSSESPNV